MNLFHIFFVIYFLQVIIHFILLYKIMKLEKIISGFADFMMKANSVYPLVLQILLGKKKNNSLVIKLFRLNSIIALIIFTLLILTVVSPI